jgi:hypothetical protein
LLEQSMKDGSFDQCWISTTQNSYIKTQQNLWNQ